MFFFLYSFFFSEALVRILHILRRQMLDRMECTRMNDGLAVRLFHTDVESRDGLTANLILTGDIDTTQQFLVVNGK